MPIPRSTPHDSTAPQPPPPILSTPRAGAFVLHDQVETTPYSIVAPTQIIDDTKVCINRIEQRIKSLHVSDGVIGWNGYDDLPMVTLLVEFHMPDIERYTRIGCPYIHLQLYNAVMCV